MMYVVHMTEHDFVYLNLTVENPPRHILMDHRFQDRFVANNRQNDEGRMAFLSLVLLSIKRFVAKLLSQYLTQNIVLL